MVENNNSPSAQAGPSDGAGWATYLAIALVSCFMGLASFFVAVFSINEFVITLSIITSVVVFFTSMVFFRTEKLGLLF